MACLEVFFGIASVGELQFVVEACPLLVADAALPAAVAVAAIKTSLYSQAVV